MLFNSDGVRFFFFFGSAYIFFGLAVQLPAHSTARYALTALNIASGIAALKTAGGGGFEFCHLWALATVNVALHAFSLLALEGRVVDMSALSLHQCARTAWRHWSNIRSLTILEKPTKLSDTSPSYLTFALNKCLRIYGLWQLSQLDLRIATEIIVSLNMPISDDHRPLPTPLPSPEHLLYWAYESIRWIIYTWWALTAAHDFFSVIFVSILRWDTPSEWPPLYCSPLSAFSLRRFWGTFWHTLNRNLADAYLPCILSFLSPLGPYAKAADKTPVPPALRALWVFFFSALFHAAANVARYGRPEMLGEMKFFMANFGVCWVETVVGRACRGRTRMEGKSDRRKGPGLMRRVVGYVWVYLVFFVLGPGWRWDLVWEGLRGTFVARGMPL